MDAVSDLFTKRLKAPYDTYFGFDSFEGLPAEAAGVAMPPHGQWQPGQFSDVMQLSEGVKTKVDNNFVRTYVGKTAPLSVDAVVKSYERKLNAKERRMRLVPGFYNESLTTALAQSAGVAKYININCNLWVSTTGALRWLFKNRLMGPGTLISYDDWFEASVDGGEVLAHLDITREFRVEWQYLPLPSAWMTLDVSCHLVFFRVASIGRLADDGITVELLRRGCALGQPPCGDGHGLQKRKFFSMVGAVERQRSRSKGAGAL